MQSAFIKDTDQKVYAWHAELEGERFVCTGCAGTMFLKNGMVRVAHFAHAPESHCAFARYESELEVTYKVSIYEALVERYGAKGRIDVEHTGIAGCRPAVFINGRKHRIAIELLVDATDVREIINKSEIYFALNVGVIWVLPFDSERLNGDRLKMKEHEKLLCFMNNKRLLFWHLRRKSFSVAEFGAAYGESTEFYDKNQGDMVYYEGRKLRSTFNITNLINNIYPEDLTRWVSSKRFEMETYKYPLPKSILWKYQPPPKNRHLKRLR
ncbi:competence protein CoiA family protein [Mucilaginibacter sp. SP1R1]|uniref:competence protein CoiA family protein n=1 Tax=Mucilaginibacter sp. SP1R1 TaxID=2723091 RepID=UPI0016157FF1|nr:competence protein CoiA family protein [Mucilaginibacter sp. SP1R1]MBB6149584.1 competence CoiA-like predicted nuclease [Mucilaginibacter sp. SP1R1]